MGEKAIITILIGFVLFLICGAISLVGYIVYLLQASFVEHLALLGMAIGLMLFLVGATVMRETSL